jgi:uncharacterized protein (TIGR03000 family)
MSAPAYSQPIYGESMIQPAGQAPVTPIETEKVPMTNPAQPANPQDKLNDTSAGAANGDARLRIHLPADAVVLVNGKPTKTTGTIRSYVSRRLAKDRSYPFEIKASVVREGKELVQTKVVDLTAGVDKSVDFAFDGPTDTVTSLSLSVPEDAKVSLAGSETTTTGSFRYFSTKGLAQGSEWKDYEVVVTVVRDGRELSRREVVSLAAGESRHLTFDFEDVTLASSK